MRIDITGVGGLSVAVIERLSYECRHNKHGRIFAPAESGKPGNVQHGDEPGTHADMM